MSTLRISNIEAKADSSSPTVDEQLKFTNSDGDVLLHLDGRTAGITTVGINTTNQTIKFDSNNNILITGIVTATEFHGSLAVGTSVTYGDNEKAYFGTGLDLELFHNGTNSIINNTEGALLFQNNGSSSMYIASDGQVSLNNDITFIGASANALWDKSENYFSIPDKIVHSGDTNTAIRFPANDTISFETGGDERLRITSDGNLLVGATAVEDWDGSRSHRIQVRGDSTYNAGMSVLITANNDNPSELVLGKSRSTGNTIVGSADDVGQVRWSANDGAGFHSVAYIRCSMDGTPGSNDLPSNLRFGTCADGGTTVTERLRIASDGDVTFGTGMQPGAAVNIISDKNVETDIDDMANYHLVLKNPQNDTGEAIGLAFGITDTVTKVGAAIIHERDSSGSQGSLKFFTRPNNAGPPVERVRIDSSGTLVLTNSTNPTLQIKTGTTSRLKIIGDTGASKVLISSQEGYPLALGAASGGGTSEALRIDSSGRVYIGATSGGNADTDDLVISGSGKKGITICSTDGSESRLTFADGLSGVNAVAGNITYTHSNDSLDFYTATSRRLRIGSNGSMYLGYNVSDGLPVQDGSIPGNLRLFSIHGTGTSLGIKLTNSTTGTTTGDGVDIRLHGQTAMINQNETYDLQLQSKGELAFRTGSTPAERLRISSTGQATFDKGAPSSSNQVIARFQAESSRRLDIVWHDSGSLLGFDLPGSHSYIFKCAGSEKLRITSAGKIGVKNANPTARVDFAYDSGTNGNAFMQFKGPDNKSGEMLHKRVFNGWTGGGDVNLLEVTSWQSVNSRIFGVVKIMAVNPLSNDGYLAEGWFFKADDGSADVGTVTKVHDKGGSVGSLNWSSDTLRYTTPSTSYLDMHISVEYHIYDGGTVVFDTTTRSLS